MRRFPFLALIGLIASPLWAGSQPLTSQRQNALLDLLHQDCGSCHGMTLKGGLGPALLPSTLQGKPDALLTETILKGRAGTAMPPWRELITAEEALWLVHQLKNPSP